MGGTLNTQNSKILSTLLSLKFKIVEKCNQIYSMVTFVEQKLDKIVILPNFPNKFLGRS
jgi:hypothetical protein